MEAALENPVLTVALALAAGMIAHVAARHLQVPGIVLLLLTGVLLGPEVAGVVRPETMGRSLLDLVGMAVAVILFEGGLNLSVHRLRGEAVPLRRLITVGALTTAAMASGAAYLIMGWPWELVVPFGALLVVTGPTVVQPVLRRVPVRRSLATVLEGEAVFIDAIGAILAVVALEFVLATGAVEAATDLLAFPARFGIGLGLGVAGGLVVGLLLRTEGLVPEGLENVLALAFVLAFFEVSEAVMAETGIMTAAVAGLVVGNMETGVAQELKEFKEQLTVLMLGLIFVLLAATVRLEDVLGLGWRGVATVAVIMFLIRPLSVAISTVGTDLDMRERAFLAWLAPRGVVAAAVAALFAQSLGEVGVAGAPEL
jgi:NhaP-type Na+/H+ or K+/H+ antiporter